MASIGFGRRFATYKEHIREGFDIVMEDVQITEEVKERLYWPFEIVTRAGLGHRAQRAVIDEVFDGLFWRWPLLEQAAERFVDQDIWPMRWNQIGIARPMDWNAIMDDGGRELLTFALWKTFSQRRYLAQFEVWRTRIPDIPSPLKLSIGDKTCMVERLMVQRYAAVIEAGDHRVLPPFFPGDGCYLSGPGRLIVG